MLIAQITDTHIKPNGALAYGNVLDSALCLKNVVKHCNKFNPTIDLAIVTGDLTDSGKIEEYEEFYNSGKYNFDWNAESFSTGVYFFTINADVDGYVPVVFSRKMIYLK